MASLLSVFPRHVIAMGTRARVNMHIYVSVTIRECRMCFVAHNSLDQTPRTQVSACFTVKQLTTNTVQGIVRTRKTETVGEVFGLKHPENAQLVLSYCSECCKNGGSSPTSVMVAQ